MFKSTWVKWLGAVLLVGITAALTYWFFAPAADKPDLLGASEKLAGRTNILVLGVDQREGDAGEGAAEAPDGFAAEVFHYRSSPEFTGACRGASCRAL